MQVFRSMPKGMNRGAFGTPLVCPHLLPNGQKCGSQNLKFIEMIGLRRYRYRCHNCGKFFQYDVGGAMDHPYAPLKKKRWQDLIMGTHPLDLKVLKQKGESNG